MTLPQPQPPAEMALELDTKSRVPLAPNSLISSSSSSAIGSVSAEHLSDDEVSLSDTDSTTSSIRSTSDTYVNDLGGDCVRDTDWPADLVSRVEAFRVYDSTDDEEDPTRREARALLESADIGVYEKWAEIADDELSLEALQEEADAVAKAIEGVSVNGDSPERHDERKRRRPDVPIDNRPVVTSIESLDDDVVSAIPVVDMASDVDRPTKPARRRKGHRRVETLPDDDLSDLSMPWGGFKAIPTFPDDDDLDLPPLPVVLSPPNEEKRGHHRIETLPDGNGLDLMKPTHRRIETLPDGDDLDIPSPPSLRRIETLPDSTLNMPTPPSLQEPPSLVEVEVGELSDAGAGERPVATMPGHKRIETLPDEDAMNGVLCPLDRRRDDEEMAFHEEIRVQKVDSLSDEDSAGCVKLARLSERVADVTRGLADIQMITAGQAASAEECLGKMNKTSLRAEVCQLRITLDHLARLTLERAYKTRDEAERHG